MKTQTVLIVDDDATIRAMYSDFLKKSGFDVLTAESGEAGLAVLAGGEKKVDLVVTDIMMARMDGWQMLDFIREDMELDEVDLPVIVMSAVESIDLDMEFMRHRANDWVTKPVKPMEVLSRKIMVLLGLGAAEDD